MEGRRERGREGAKKGDSRILGDPGHPESLVG